MYSEDKIRLRSLGMPTWPTVLYPTCQATNNLSVCSVLFLKIWISDSFSSLVNLMWIYFSLNNVEMIAIAFTLCRSWCFVCTLIPSIIFSPLPVGSPPPFSRFSCLLGRLWFRFLYVPGTCSCYQEGSFAGGGRCPGENGRHTTKCLKENLLAWSFAAAKKLDGRLPRLFCLFSLGKA